VAGERRFRAAQLAGLERIPVVIRQVADRDQLELALVENLQREGPEPGRRGARLPAADRRVRVDAGGVAARIGRARSTVANTLRLLDLGTSLSSSTSSTERSRRGTRVRSAACPPTSRRGSADIVIERGLSTRETEELVRRLREPRPDKVVAAAAPRDADRRTGRGRPAPDARHEGDGSPARAREGRIVIEYYSDEELGQLYDRLIGWPA
jgi:ParB family chromosome partitioning protein